MSNHEKSGGASFANSGYNVQMPPVPVTEHSLIRRVIHGQEVWVKVFAPRVYTQRGTVNQTTRAQITIDPSYLENWQTQRALKVKQERNARAGKRDGLKERIVQLHAAGGSIDNIASQLGRSQWYVQKVIDKQR